MTAAGVIAADAGDVMISCATFAELLVSPDTVPGSDTPNAKTALVWSLGSLV